MASEYLNYLTNNKSVADLESKKSFLDLLLIAFKTKNQSETITIFHYLHMQERLSNWQVTVPDTPPIVLGAMTPVWHLYAGQQYTINLMNVYPTADIEAAYFALLWGQPDDMTQPDHWLSAERKAWLENEVKTWLGWP